MKEETKKKRKGWRLGRDSYHKLWVLFQDGRKRTRYSIDWKHAYSKTRDPAIGFYNFRRMMKRWGMEARSVIIYNIKTNKRVAQYFEGEEIEIDDDP
ncbi:hypothetical protein [uncultured Aquimarina sp.]|uniref:hypothetical protein n=1 Tax=uncultured Aquimarina sp. TaxID=575652 RepID=UPI00262471E9|nr:hypothetical protein [uncultured Aquimarina sp.]